MSALEKSHMAQRQVTRPFDGDTLAEIGRGLHGRLRAHHVSERFIDRHLEDAVQKGVIEYLRVRADGVEVREPEGFVAEAAFRRALDEVRRESRRADGTALEEILETGRRATAAAEEVAIDNLESRKLQDAIDALPAEQRQVLVLHYFEELDQRHAAERLYMSERTFRRRLRRTLADLAHLLGSPAPDPGSHHGLEVGLAAWAGLGGGRVVASTGIAGHLASLLDFAHRAPARVVDRVRGPGTRLVASEAPERLGAVAGGPVGKVIGGCAGAAIVCALSGVVGPGVGLGGGGSRPSHRPPHPVASAGKVATRPILVEPPPITDGESGAVGAAGDSTSGNSSTPTRRGSGRSAKAAKKTDTEAEPTEAEAAEEQFSAISRAAAESEGESTGSEAEEAAVEEATPARSTGSSGSAGSSAEERQAKEQFGFGR
ncbi:MAG: sigma-70 family RNA polymerase sigma factor [Solirubrobacterales bacterium]